MATMQNIIRTALTEAIQAQADGKAVLTNISGCGHKAEVHGVFDLDTLSHRIATAAGLDNMVAIPVLDFRKLGTWNKEI